MTDLLPCDYRYLRAGDLIVARAKWGTGGNDGFSLSLAPLLSGPPSHQVTVCTFGRVNWFYWTSPQPCLHLGLVAPNGLYPCFYFRPSFPSIASLPPPVSQRKPSTPCTGRESERLRGRLNPSFFHPWTLSSLSLSFFQTEGIISTATDTGFLTRAMAQEGEGRGEVGGGIREERAMKRRRGGKLGGCWSERGSTSRASSACWFICCGPGTLPFVSPHHFLPFFLLNYCSSVALFLKYHLESLCTPKYLNPTYGLSAKDSKR